MCDDDDDDVAHRNVLFYSGKRGPHAKRQFNLSRAQHALVATQKKMENEEKNSLTKTSSFRMRRVVHDVSVRAKAS